MFEYHGWATLRDSLPWLRPPGTPHPGGADALTRSTLTIVQAEIETVRNDFQIAEVQVLNGSAQLRLAGLRNHRRPAVIEVFRRVAEVAPWSYGMLHVFDDELDGENGNRWVAYVMKRGSVTEEIDPHLSPHIDVVEDEEPFADED